MQKIKNISLVNRLTCLFLALYIFNFSIDSKDPMPDSVAEDLSLNDVESVYEFIMEDLLGFENAVEERDEPDQDDGGSFDFKKIYVRPFSAFIKLPEIIILKRISGTAYTECFAPNFIEIDSPPPKG